MTAVEAALEALDAAAARAVETFSLTSDELATVSDAFAKIELALKLENFLGSASTSDAFVVRLSSDALPSVSIIGGSDREVAVHRALSVEADAAATTCDGRSAKDSGVEYAWQIYHLTDWSNTGANPTVETQRPATVTNF